MYIFKAGNASLADMQHDRAVMLCMCTRNSCKLHVGLHKPALSRGCSALQQGVTGTAAQWSGLTSDQDGCGGAEAQLWHAKGRGHNSAYTVLQLVMVVWIASPAFAWVCMVWQVHRKP